ncbi:uncharacterized protein EV422DRAFT_567982 [Fimicolochytrium jonesii]|uniref:uncharacterized protein n=1 Tax=Fimicolochytrium jonesii TaxID=1396493 RepID=UPI0022FF31EF|nr:uncharacterized protein EV422DRAFT_567982 [Fimicolochytrium jonesii]KAI8820555.1 hypothetical protein EV422DRAFT_567982 [Fimicolochytrium jonesii]
MFAAFMKESKRQQHRHHPSQHHPQQLPAPHHHSLPPCKHATAPFDGNCNDEKISESVNEGQYNYGHDNLTPAKPKNGLATSPMGTLHARYPESDALSALSTQCSSGLGNISGAITAGYIDVGVGAAVTTSRMGALDAGDPESVALSAVNKQCSSGLASCGNIAGASKAGYMDVGVGAGVSAIDIDAEMENALIESNAEEVKRTATPDFDTQGFAAKALGPAPTPPTCAVSSRAPASQPPALFISAGQKVSFTFLTTGRHHQINNDSE